VATGTVLAGVTSPALDMTDHTGATTPATGRVFGVIGAWDGHRVGKGRVVVDSTWHHFFNINLSGDRYLEPPFALSPSNEQKRHGFYVPDGMGGRKRADEYEQIRWYYRNIVYWLIPASRRAILAWDAIAELVSHHRFAEELAALDLRAVTVVTLDRFLYFGQLAEQYFSSVRGACTSYLIKLEIYKPKIPWWEWVQDVVDVWDPGKVQAPRESGEKEQWLGGMGMAPRAEVPGTLSLGAAVVAAAHAQRQVKAGADLSSAAAEVFPSVLGHAVRGYAEALKHGAEQLRRLATVAAGEARSSGR
jgi:hypothetical protein